MEQTYLYSRDSIDYNVEGIDLRNIVNYYEMIVLELLRTELDLNPPICVCQSCIEDIFALALNALPSKYIQQTGYYKIREGKDVANEDTIRMAIKRAIHRVELRPNH